MKKLVVVAFVAKRLVAVALVAKRRVVVTELNDEVPAVKVEKLP